ncbi:MAG TPA: hypothetical protein VGS79_21630 [Puia sp.]|nr:hypothetical protein [Puia sp.]
MKSDLVHSRVQMEKTILERLVAEVKETVATDVAVADDKARKSSFSALNLWAIRRNRRYPASALKQPRIVNGFGY